MPLFLRDEYGLRHFLSSVYPAMENRRYNGSLGDLEEWLEISFGVPNCS